ncbi:MAG: non-canonical purine NTP pyrophosphatase [Candidatus Micrarchaeaceae archaeon]
MEYAVTPTIFVATKNQRKLADFRLYLGGKYNVLSPAEMNIDMNVPEGINSIEDNALAKARAWALRTNKIAVGDDTGFFINALYGEPGVATRRWAGELHESATSEQFWGYLQQKIKDLQDLSCYFEQCIAVYAPNGNYRLVYSRNKGILNRGKLTKPYNGSDYPLAAIFEADNRPKTWDEMTDAEKTAFDSRLIDDLNRAITEVMLA